MKVFQDHQSIHFIIVQHVGKKNKVVVELMIEFWPNLIKLRKFWKLVPKSKQPTCKSYKNVCDAMQDPFMISELTFFSFVCGLTEP